MLHSVPAQSSAPHPGAHPRAAAFQRAVEAALPEPGPDALAAIMRQYLADTQAMESRIAGLTAEASAMASERRRQHVMMQQVQMAAATKVWEGARMGAELATYREMIGELLVLADKAAEGGTIERQALVDVLNMEPMEAVHTPLALAFLPDDKFRGGQFTSEPSRDVTFVFTFIGWALIDHGPGAYGIVEPMFLVDDKAMAKSSIEHERHVRLEQLLPAFQRAA